MAALTPEFVNTTEIISVSNIDSGLVLDACNEAIRTIERDIFDRPFLKKARKVTLVISITPENNGEQDEDLITPVVGFEVKPSIPARQGRTSTCIIRTDKKGQKAIVTSVRTKKEEAEPVDANATRSRFANIPAPVPTA